MINYSWTNAVVQKTTYTLICLLRESCIYMSKFFHLDVEILPSFPGQTWVELIHIHLPFVGLEAECLDLYPDELQMSVMILGMTLA